MVHKYLGIKMWVAESEVEQFKAAGHKLAADSKPEKPIMNKPEIKVDDEPKKETKKENKRDGAEKAQEEPVEVQKPLPEPPQPPPVKKKKESGGSLLDFLPLVKTALDLLNEFRRKLRVDDLYLRLILASDDPCDLAVNYGRAWAALGNLMPQLEKLFVIKKRNVEVECDFTAAETLVIARLDLTITLGRILSIAVRYGVRGLMTFLKIKKQREGGADL